MNYKLKKNQQFALRLNKWKDIEQDTPNMGDYQKVANLVPELNILDYLENEEVVRLNCIVLEDNQPICNISKSQSLRKTDQIKWNKNLEESKPEDYELWITNSVNLTPKEFLHKLQTDEYIYDDEDQEWNQKMQQEQNSAQSLIEEEFIKPITHKPATHNVRTEEELESLKHPKSIIDDKFITIDLTTLNDSLKQNLKDCLLKPLKEGKQFFRMNRKTGAIGYCDLLNEPISVKDEQAIYQVNKLIYDLDLYRWNLKDEEGKIETYPNPKAEVSLKNLLYNETWDYWDKEDFDKAYNNKETRKPIRTPKPLPFEERIEQALKLGHNIKLEGHAGSGKTTLARKLAKKLGLKMYKMTLTRQTTQKDLVGYYNPVLGVNVTSPILEAYKNGGLLFIDEMDAGDPNTLIIVNSVCDRELANPITGELLECHPDFKVISAINLSDELHNYVGKNKLDKSTNSRYKNFKMDNWQHRFDSKILELHKKINEIAVKLGKGEHWCDLRQLDRLVIDIPVLGIKQSLIDLTEELNLDKSEIQSLVDLY